MYKKGFTLIELLVVIAIIGLLSSIVMASLQTARSKGRDARLVSEVRNLQTALELYYLSNGHYPLSANCGATSPNSGWCNSVESLSNGHWIKDNGVANVLAPYIDKEPYPANQSSPPNWVDTGGEKSLFYFSGNYGGDGQWYMLVFALENPNKTLEASDGVTAPNGTYFHYGNDTNGVLTVGISTRN